MTVMRKLASQTNLMTRFDNYASYFCFVPHLVQNLESILILDPHSIQYLVSIDRVSLLGGVTSARSVSSVRGDIPLYISVTAPLGLNVSSMSGVKSETILAPSVLFSSTYSINRGT